MLCLAVPRSTAAVSWLTHKEPRGPRPVCSLLLERLGKVEAEAAGLLDDGSGAGLGRKGEEGGCSGKGRAGRPRGQLGSQTRHVAHRYVAIMNLCFFNMLTRTGIVHG